MFTVARAMIFAGTVGALVFIPAIASAELVFFSTGRTLSVRAFREENGRTVLTLRAGGEILCDSSLILRIEPDEVPWPEPVVEPEAVVPPATMIPFDQLIAPLATQHGVDPALVLAVVETESAFEPAARSPKGAMGLMQLMPGTARLYSVDDPFNPRDNLDAGIRHLKSLLDRYDIRLALAAYNAGEASVRRYGGVPPYRETQDYVNRVLRRLEEYRRGRGTGQTATRPALASPTS